MNWTFAQLLLLPEAEPEPLAEAGAEPEPEPELTPKPGGLLLPSDSSDSSELLPPPSSLPELRQQ